MRRMYTLLLLTPQPRDSDPIDNRQDAQGIGYRLNQLGLSSTLKVVEKINPRFADLPFFLDDLKPQLLHFSGHSTRSSKLLFVDNKGNRHDVPPEALVQQLATSDPSRKYVKGFVLNTCYSLSLAQALVDAVDFVVANAGEIQDESAGRFAETFYPLFSKGQTLQSSFDQGRAQVLANLKSGQEPPTLLVRPGIDPTKYTLFPQKEDSVFVHYLPECAEDRRMAGELFKMLKAHKVPYWDVTQTKPGTRLSDGLDQALDRSAYIIPLISPDTMANDGWTHTLGRALERAKSGQTIVLPVFLRPTLRPPVLEDMPHFPANGKAVSQYKSRDEIWVNVVKTLRQY